MGAEAIHVAHSVLINFGIIFLAGAVAGKIAQVMKVPDVVLYLLVGILIGPPLLNWVDISQESALNQLMLIIGAAFLLFHGGTGISFKVLKNVWLTLTLLATVAVFVMVGIVGYTVYIVLGVKLMTALLLAAVIASTDPATLVPIFLAIKIKDRVAQTVLSESAFNDATGAIVTFAILGAMTTGQVSLTASLTQFVIMAGGGILIGAFYGIILGICLSNKFGGLLAEGGQVLLLPAIIAAYMTAERFGASGFMAVFIVGLIYGNLKAIGWEITEERFHAQEEFINNASLLLRMVIFILLGTHVDFGVVKQYLAPGLIIVTVFMFIARPVAVLICTLPDRKARWSKNEVLFMFWTRETGVIPAALAGMIYGLGVENADIIAAITFLAILATLIIQASTTKWLAQKLNLME